MARDVPSIAIVSEAAHSSDAPDAAARPREGNIVSMLALRATPVSAYRALTHPRGTQLDCNGLAVLDIRGAPAGVLVEITLL